MSFSDTQSAENEFAVDRCNSLVVTLRKRVTQLHRRGQERSVKADPPARLAENLPAKRGALQNWEKVNGHIVTASLSPFFPGGVCSESRLPAPNYFAVYPGRSLYSVRTDVPPKKRLNPQLYRHVTSRPFEHHVTCWANRTAIQARHVTAGKS